MSGAIAGDIIVSNFETDPVTSKQFPLPGEFMADKALPIQVLDPTVIIDGRSETEGSL